MGNKLSKDVEAEHKELVSSRNAYIDMYMESFGGKNKDQEVVRYNMNKLRGKLYLGIPFLNKREKKFLELSDILEKLGLSDGWKDSFVKIDLLTRFANDYGYGSLEFVPKYLDSDNPKIKKRELALSDKERKIIIRNKGF